jgi:hypothetical protein
MAVIVMVRMHKKAKNEVEEAGVEGEEAKNELMLRGV